MRLHVVALMMLLLAVPAVSGAPTPESATRIQALTADGLELAYNFEFTAADRLFDEAIAVDTLYPRPYASKSFVALWHFLLSKNDSDYHAFLSLVDRCINAGERYIDTYGENAEALTCLGMAYGYRAFAHGRVKSYLKAAWDGKKSYDHFSDALKLDPHAYDAYLGIGMFHYFAAHISKPMRWIVSILGISGDSDLGMKEIRVAAAKGTFAKVEAQYFLAQFLPWNEGDFTTGERMVTELYHQYPRNALLQFTLAVWEIRRNDVRSAKERLASIVHQLDMNMRGLRSFATYKLAECCYRLSEYDEARTLYQTFLGAYADHMYRATSNYRIGICLEMTGQRKASLPFYERAAASDRTFGDDAYSARKADHRLKVPLSPADTSLLRAQNALNSGAYPEALSMFSSVKSLQGTPPALLAESDFGIAETLFDQGLYSDALQQYQQVLSISPDEEVWLLPWSHYQSGLCYLKLGKNENARKEFEKVHDSDTFDFKDWLFFRTDRELDKLAK